MDIEGFYEQNEARRSSPEIEFGSRWTDAAGNEYELSWVEATGELYLMLEPDAHVTEDAFGDFIAGPEVTADMSVVVIATVETTDELAVRLDGWQEAESRPNSLAWLAERLRD